MRKRQRADPTRSAQKTKLSRVRLARGYSQEEMAAGVMAQNVLVAVRRALNAPHTEGGKLGRSR